MKDYQEPKGSAIGNDDGRRSRAGTIARRGGGGHWKQSPNAKTVGDSRKEEILNIKKHKGRGDSVRIPTGIGRSEYTYIRGGLVVDEDCSIPGSQNSR